MKNKILTAAVALLATVVTVTAQAEVIAAQSTNPVTGNTTTTYYFDNDANNNGIIDSTEFPQFVTKRWDMNRDGFITDAEWQASTARWFPKNVETKTYTHWDKDADGRLDANEVNTVVTTTKLYNVWDTNADAVIQADEYASANFAIYDVNNDGNINREEWAYVR